LVTNSFTKCRLVFTRVMTFIHQASFGDRNILLDMKITFISWFFVLVGNYDNFLVIGVVS
jgi:hypothetical protein